MKRWMLGLCVVLFSATLAAAQPPPPTPVPSQPGVAYLLLADNVSRPLPFRLHHVS
jgi:hypothetical protein